MAMAGVVKVYDPSGRSQGDRAATTRSWQDEVGPRRRSPFRAARQNDRDASTANQPVALVVAETFEAARDAASPSAGASSTSEEEHITDLDAVKGSSL